MAWNYIPDPPGTNIYPPIYPPYPPPTQPPPGVSKSEWRDQIRMAKAIMNFDKKKNKEEPKKEKRGVAKLTGKDYSFVEVFLLLMLIGPFVGPAWNKFETLILKMINGN